MLRSEAKRWEEKCETQILSRHGFHLTCQQELNLEEVVSCERLDNGWCMEARVVWSRRKDSGETEAGFEFLDDEDFWGIATILSKTTENKR